jgi:hypothetical protein
MKISKSQLQKIIKEEMEAMMGQVTIGDEVDVIGGVMVGAVGEIVAMGSEDGKQIVVLNLLRPAADERYKDLGPQVIIQPDFIEKRIKEELTKEFNGGEDLGDIAKIIYVEAYHPQGGSGLYALEVFDKSGEKERFQYMRDFNKRFGTDFSEREGVMSFGQWMNKMAPHIEVEEDEMDVS